MAWKKRNKDFDFKPDVNSATWLKTSRLTRQQRLRLAKWVLYWAMILLGIVLQDSIMSQFRLFGATTDLAVCVILLITVLEGTDVGSLFVLLASLFYYFSGSAPGGYCIGLLTFIGIGATMVRQMYLHRSRGSITIFTGIAVMLYELGLFVMGLAFELTIVSRFSSFVMTGVYSALVLIPLYPLIYKIGTIGGITWKE